MVLPFRLIPVLIGAAIGSVVTYILTSRNARKQLSDGLGEVGDTVEDAADAVSDAAKKAASKMGG